MAWIWILFGALAGMAGFRYRSRLRASRPGGPPRVDDAAVRRILEQGTLAAEDEDEDEPLDMREAARAEEEFWRDSWDEPEEYGR